MRILTYWLIPAEPARSYFASLIADLGARFDAPVFEPHITIYTTTVGEDNPGELLESNLAGATSYSLSITGADFSDKFTKTVFVQFESDAALTALSGKFRAASKSQKKYELNPHLSLIYKTMPRGMKEEIANSLRFPFREVRFDSVKAVISPADIKSRADVEAWRVVATQKLGK
jgi:2'-5' RNA ligase